MMARTLLSKTQRALGGDPNGYAMTVAWLTGWVVIAIVFWYVSIPIMKHQWEVVFRSGQ